MSKLWGGVMGEKGMAPGREACLAARRVTPAPGADPSANACLPVSRFLTPPHTPRTSRHPRPPSWLLRPPAYPAGRGVQGHERRGERVRRGEREDERAVVSSGGVGAAPPLNETAKASAGECDCPHSAAHTRNRCSTNLSPPKLGDRGAGRTQSRAAAAPCKPAKQPRTKKKKKSRSISAALFALIPLPPSFTHAPQYFYGPSGERYRSRHEVRG